MKRQWSEYVARIATETGKSLVETRRMLALQRCNQQGGKKASSPYEVVATQVRHDFTLAMVHYNTKHSSPLPENEADSRQKQWDLTIYVVYDHRQGKSLEDVC